MNFSWVGLPVKPYYDKIDNGNYNFYKSFHYRGEEFKVGEQVIVSKSKTHGRIGMLLCLYQSYETKDRTTPFRGIVSWFTKVKRLPAAFNPGKIKFDMNNEVIQNNTETDVVISLEDVTKKCNVVYCAVEDPVYLISANKLDPKFNFSCRYKVEQDCIVPIFSSNVEDYIVDGKLTIVPDFENFEEASEASTIKFESVFLPPIDVTPTKRLCEIQNVTRIKSARKASASSLGYCSSDEHIPEDAVRSSTNPSKFLKFDSNSENHISRRKSPLKVRRDLNKSFKSSICSSSDNSPVAYSIINSTDEGLKLTLKMKEKIPVVLSTKLDDMVFNLKNLKVSNLQEVNNEIQLSPPKRVSKTSETGPVRRSTRNNTRKSYADYKSPNPETPKKLTRQTSTGVATFKTPRISRCTPRSQSIDISPENELFGAEKNSVKLNSKTRRSTRCIQWRQLIDVSSEDEAIGEKKNVVTLNSKTPRRSSRFTRKSLMMTDESVSPSNSETRRSSRSTKKSEIIEEKPVSPRKVPVTPKSSATSLRKNLLVRSSSKKLILEEESEEEDLDNAPLGKRKKSLSLTKKLILEEEEGEEEVLKNTALSKRKKSICTPKVDTPSARAKKVRDGLITPSVASRKANVVQGGTPLQRARTQLHVSHVPTDLPCREKEFSDLVSFLEGKLLDGCGGCMYVSGVPGTGKTATVTEVIRSLQESANDGHIPSFKYININGMKLSEPRQSYVEIVKQLSGKTLAWEQAQTNLENKFVKSKAHSQPIILVVDELDILCTKRQDVVYNLLDWPSKGNAQLIVITIANTMDLPERLLMGRVTSRLGLTRLTFQAYTHKQLQEIVTKRLTGTDAFNTDAIQLVARKVASISGDARRALDICRRSAEIAELEGDKTLVTMNHVNKAISAMITQPKVLAIKHCSMLEKLILQAASAEVERTGVDETTFDYILIMLGTLAALQNFKLPSVTILLRTVARLGASRLLLTEQNCNDLYQKILLNVSSDDIYYAMQNF